MRENRLGARGERGAVATEYALVIGLVSLLVIAGPVGLGVNFTGWANALAEQIGVLLR